MIVYEVQKDRLYWVKYDVFGLENLLDHDHVPLRNVFLLISYVLINFSNMAVVLS